MWREACHNVTVKIGLRLVRRICHQCVPGNIWGDVLGNFPNALGDLAFEDFFDAATDFFFFGICVLFDGCVVGMIQVFKKTFVYRFRRTFAQPEEFSMCGFGDLWRVDPTWPDIAQNFAILPDLNFP